MLKGSFSPSGDKSVSHRAALFSILAAGETLVENYSPGDDCQSSLGTVEALGGKVERLGDNRLRLTGLAGKVNANANLDCGNSGTTIRLLMGILSPLKGEFLLDGDQYLRKRPMKRIADPLRQMDADIVTGEHGGCPLTVRGHRLGGIRYELPIASAQLKSALLLAALNANGATQIIEPVKSRDHTELMLKSFGASIVCEPGLITLSPSELTLPETFYVPADPSSAAFFLCAAALIPGSEVTAKGILLNPTRAAFIDVLKRMGANVTIETRSDIPEPWGDVTVTYNGRLKATDILPEEVPSLIDEVPILSLVASLADGTSVFPKVGELRVKETDRLLAVQKELGKFGARVEIKQTDDDCRLVIEGIKAFTTPEHLESYGDHRMAMTLRLALLCAGGDCPITEEECVSVSYPSFHEDLARLQQ